MHRSSRPKCAGTSIGALRSGLSLPEACSEVGLPPATVKSWLARGRREDQTEDAPFRGSGRGRSYGRPGTSPREDIMGLLEAAAKKGSVRAIALLLGRIDRAAEARGPISTSTRLGGDLWQRDWVAHGR